MKLIGLDFETANRERGSICQVGVAVLEDGRITDRKEWFVRPPPECDYVVPAFVAIHGITEERLADAPRFPIVWKEMSHYLAEEGACVVAHNAPFDIGQLSAALNLYELEPVPFDYVCSLRISRRVLPGLPSYTLDKVALKFGCVFRHHDALADAVACATIVSHTGIPEGFRRPFIEA